MGQRNSVLVLCDSGMNNNELLKQKLTTNWDVTVKSKLKKLIFLIVWLKSQMQL